MSWKFEPRDFDTGNHPISTYEYMATAANRKLQEWIAASPVVRSHGDGVEWYTAQHGRFQESGSRNSAVQGRIIMIEYIQKDTAESLLRELVDAVPQAWLTAGAPRMTPELINRARKILDGGE